MTIIQYSTVTFSIHQLFDTKHILNILMTNQIQCKLQSFLICSTGSIV